MSGQPEAAAGFEIAPSAALERLLARRDLTRDEVRGLFGRLMDGGLEEPVKAGLLVALAVKGETAEELAGAALAMRERAVRIPHRRECVVDTCGTGGDGKGSFNISTAAALVAAAAGVPVAKHGNRSVSSRSGSADVLEALGVAIDHGPETAGRCLDELGIAFLFAPLLHPAMREVMAVRRALRIRTTFNLLGPLTNPAGARRQLVGVYAPAKVALVAEVLLRLQAEHALVVHGTDGLDEITVAGETDVAEVRSGVVRCWRLAPERFGMARSRPQDLAGGEPRENAARLEAVLAGERGPLADVVVLNAAAAIWVGSVAADLAEGVERAREAVASGAAARTLEHLRRFGG